MDHIDEMMINSKCSNLEKILRSKNVPDEEIVLRISRYKNFVLDHIKKSVVITETDEKTSNSRQTPGTHAALTPKRAEIKQEPGEQLVTEKTSISIKSPIQDVQNTSLRTDGDSGISSERKSPVGLVSRALSTDSATRDCPNNSHKSNSEQSRCIGTKTETTRRSLTGESSRPSKRRSLTSSSSRSRSRSWSRSRSRSDSRSRSKRRNHKKHKKNKKRRKHHRRRSHRRSDRRSHSARSPSYSRYRSRSRSHSRRGRRRRHKRSRSRSPAVYSSLSRSPSIRRRPGSPSHLDRRRITSARKRPVPYLRKSASSGSGDAIEGSGGAMTEQLIIRSRHSRSPSSEGFLRHRLNNLARRRRQLTTPASNAGYSWYLQTTSSIPSLMQTLPTNPQVTVSAGQSQL